MRRSTALWSLFAVALAGPRSRVDYLSNTRRGEWKPPPEVRQVEEKPPPPESRQDEWKPPPESRQDEWKPPPGRLATTIPSIQPRGVTTAPIQPRAADIECGAHTLSAGSYVIESPNHPSNYGNNFDCTYTITAEGDNVLGLSCSAFNVESHSRCAWDWLEVQGVRYCGTTAPQASGAASLDITFHADYSVVRSGFSCTISVEEPVETLACGTHSLAPGTYTIQSPNYPSNYGNNFDCEYSVTAAAGDEVSFQCSAFNLESHSRCGWDWLQVNGQKYCGTSPPPESSATSFDIQFHSDYSVVRPGYSCTFTVEDSGGTTAATTVATTQAPSGSCCCGTPNRASRIVGGEETEVYEYPWQAGLVSAGGTRTWCGGTIINSLYVMSAAHCTVNSSPSRIQVLIKEHRISNNDGQIRKSLQQIINHPSYTSASRSGYDFSLLKLSSAIVFPADNSIAPACLPSASNLFVGADAIVTGWGSTSSGGSQATTLQEVTVPVISNDACRGSYSSINPSMICAGLSQGGKDSCQGDSGGPMVSLENDRYALIGVVSWGRGCALPGYPGVYARVTQVLSWIQTNTADGQSCS